LKASFCFFRFRGVPTDMLDVTIGHEDVERHGNFRSVLPSKRPSSVSRHSIPNWDKSIEKQLLGKRQEYLLRRLFMNGMLAVTLP